MTESSTALLPTVGTASTYDRQVQLRFHDRLLDGLDKVILLRELRKLLGNAPHIDLVLERARGSTLVYVTPPEGMTVEEVFDKIVDAKAAARRALQDKARSASDDE
jgi:hypothetical protein